MARRRVRRFSGKTPIERFLILLVLAVMIGVTLAFVLPKFNTTLGQAAGEYSAVGDAAETLDTLQVVDNRKPQSRYQRALFGFREYDFDGNGCDARNDILARDLTNVQYANAEHCKVNAGILHDPYTGKTIEFKRGQSTSARVQIDHVVALNDAWRSGADTWDTHKRNLLANDPYNLLAVDGPANEAKGDANAADWLPENTQFECAYVARQIGVKAKYGLSVTSRERAAMLQVLHTCPNQEVPKQ